MKRIDAHQHFWRYNPVKDAWITGDMAAIQRDFMPDDLKHILEANGFSGCVAVQADQSALETQFLLDLAGQNPFIEGVVGWVDLQHDNIVERLEYYSHFPRLKGFRHIVQAEEDPNFLLRSSFLNGVAALERFGFTYDILIKPHQLDSATTFVAKFPNQPFVINHLAKPDIKAQERETWTRKLAAIAQYPNVYCKLSGMVTEADWVAWKPTDFLFYIDYVIEVFGADRVMFGSDWPVCLVAANFSQTVDLVERAISSLSLNEQELIWHRNATSFYRL